MKLILSIAITPKGWAIASHRATHEPSLFHVSALRVGIAIATTFALLWGACAVLP